MPKITHTAELTNYALKAFRLMGYHCWRQNNAAVFDPKIKSFRRNSSEKGVSDILGFHKTTGKFLACEIKVGKDTLSPEQTMFLGKVKSAGGLALVVRHGDDLRPLLIEAGVQLKSE